MINDQFNGLTRVREASIDAGIGGLRKADQLRDRLKNQTLEEVAREFEKLFAGMLVKEMRSTLEKGMFGEGAGSDTYGSWFDEHVGGTLADSGALDMAGILRAGLPAADLAAAAEAQTERSDVQEVRPDDETASAARGRTS